MISIENITKQYQGVTAVKDLTLSIPSGCLFGFIGPNGAGKTTTIRILAGILVPDAGTVRIAGIDLNTRPEKAKQKIGFIPDRPYLYEKLTGNEFLKFCADIYRVRPKDFIAARDRYLSLFAMQDYADHLIESYSHGMKQRLVMASALIHDPEIIIVDEPMVGLDPAAIRLVKKLFRDLADKGKTVFMSTHTLEIAESICDQVAIIHKGRILTHGTVAELQARAGDSHDRLEDLFLDLTGSGEVP
ncbi:ABC transporter ATP-binding protein [Desulfotignum phosphitoxidans]|uniref:30S ribosomal protein S6 n=1 Tax=Desulfotignum phosphitoxidans DSM 13687 TaxID=1286635 RepID=S0G7D8_9BACT|nr:ABC transporter ATP-binding protein [Desulfotignum phosphitoxidans]EMS80801.1 30S ribosomal protein S6 [Desulfotignum phosphitoxidans DSM 13687]